MTANTSPPLTWSQTPEDGASAGVVINCGGDTFHAHKEVVCARSQKLHEACNDSKEDLTVMIRDDTFDAPTMKRMLDFVYHGEYDACTAQKGSPDDEDEAATKLDVLSHLFCYAIGESYMVKELSDYALANFDETLRVVTAEDFAELVGVIASHTQALPIHRALRHVAFSRLDELAECKGFVKVLSCKHLTATLEQQGGGGGDDVYGDLQAAIQLASFGADLFRAANQTKSKTALENSRLARMFQESLQKIELLQKQIKKDSATLRKAESVHDGATVAIRSAQEQAQQAKVEVAKSQDQASLEVLRNATRDKHTLDDLNKSMAAARATLDQRTLELKVSQSILDARQMTALGQQRKASSMELKAKEEQQKSIEQQKKYAKLQAQLQGELAQVKHKLAQATQNKQSALAVQDELGRVRCELAEANEKTQRALAENKAIRKQNNKNSAATPSQAPRHAAAGQMRGQEATHHAEIVSELQAELSHARLSNFTLQRTIADLQFIILNPAQSGQGTSGGW